MAQDIFSDFSTEEPNHMIPQLVDGKMLLTMVMLRSQPLPRRLPPHFVRLN